MKQFKADWQEVYMGWETQSLDETVRHLTTQHNALCDWIEKRLGEKQTKSYTCVGEGCFPNSMVPSEGTIKIGTITPPKPSWWEGPLINLVRRRREYELALADASKALGVEIKLED